ncbi:MAG: o-succinylbenzoate synthase [Myxococcales bacterium]
MPLVSPSERSITPGTLGLYENQEPLTVERVVVHRRRLQLVDAVETAFGRFETLVRLYPEITFRSQSGEAVRGIGECSPLSAPWYDGECEGTVDVALGFLVSSLTALGEPITGITSFVARLDWIVGHNVAKTGLEGAYWDAVAQLQGVSVSRLWGGTRGRVETGITVGLQRSPGDLVNKVRAVLDQRQIARLKLKVKPGYDVTYLEALRRSFPDLRLQVDANGSYDLFDQEHLDALKCFDDFQLVMIEQPGQSDDLLDHARLLAHLDTPICLDESICHATHARQAMECWGEFSTLSKLVINVKPSRVGGYLEAMRIARLCHDQGVSVWCGGMYESALGKAANVHLSARQELNLPGDHAGLTPYFTENIALSPRDQGGWIEVPRGVGWGLGDIQRVFESP